MAKSLKYPKKLRVKLEKMAEKREDRVAADAEAKVRIPLILISHSGRSRSPIPVIPIICSLCLRRARQTA